MSEAQSNSIANLGKSLEARVAAELEARPLTEFDALLDLKNLKGESTGYVKVFEGNRVVKGSSVSIDLMPGVRYFNFHFIPDPHYNAPRYLFEGMLMPHGSQVSMDLFPDFDVIANLDDYLQGYSAVGEVYEEIRNDDRFLLQPSRLMHMRALSSPVFTLCFNVPVDNLPAIEAYAERYFDAWLDMLRNASSLSDDEAERRRHLRQEIGDSIVRLDPDRHMVVQVYGEETTCMIEAGSMY
ncbi:MAG: hypothetical protein OEU86_01705 [Gammaproteobacteria bacterium]|nr:hypothetical protein [Gammaproteobacteria bacterium]